MRKITFSTLLMLASGSLLAQTSVQDSVEMGAGYVNDVYYKLSDGGKLAQPASEWHIGFATDAYSVAIISNAGLPSPGMGQPGMSIAVWPNGTNADFETVDTAGFSTWPKLFDDSLSFELGAFNQNASGSMDYGWGEYNMTTHSITGDSVYIIKIGSSTYKLDIMDKTAGSYTFRYADVSSTTGTEVTLAASTNYSSKDFVFFNLSDGQIKDRELAGWDLWAMKYYDWYNGAYPNQVVTGILTNPRWEVAVVDAGSGNQATHTDFLSGTFSPNKNTIGQSYKSLVGMSWQVTDSKVYYLQNADGDIWKWYPTSFVGSAAGKTVFFKEQLSFAGITSQTSEFVDVYPNPIKDQFTIVFASKASDAEIIIRNQMGQIVSVNNLNTNSGINQHKLDISDLKAGMYFLELNQNGLSITENIIKN